MKIRKMFWLGAAATAFVTVAPVQAADDDGHSAADMINGRMGMMKGRMGMMGNDDAKLTREQFMQRAEARFARMDDNKDGVIDASDREKMHKRMRECMGMMGDMGMMGQGMGMGMMGGMGAGIANDKKDMKNHQ